MAISDFYDDADEVVTERAAELEHELRSVLDELGLEVVTTERDDYYEIGFVEPRKPGIEWNGFSPVMIFLYEDCFDGRSSSAWSGSFLAVESLTTRNLGDTGFRHFRNWSEPERLSDQTEIALEGKPLFRWLGNRIRSKGVVSFAGRDQGFIENGFLVDAYFAARAHVRGLSVMTYVSDDGKTMEALTFQNKWDERVHAVFNHYRVFVFVDGEARGGFDARDLDTTWLTLWKLRDDPDSASGLDQRDRPPANPYGTP